MIVGLLEIFAAILVLAIIKALEDTQMRDSRGWVLLLSCIGVLGALGGIVLVADGLRRMIQALLS